MRIRSHAGARRDLNQAVDWYIAEAGGPTATRFIEEVERLRALIVGHPRIGTPGRFDTRRVVFRSFPYTLVYRLRGDVLEVIALAHHSRRPDYWMPRT